MTNAKTLDSTDFFDAAYDAIIKARTSYGDYSGEAGLSEEDKDGILKLAEKLAEVLADSDLIKDHRRPNRFDGFKAFTYEVRGENGYLKTGLTIDEAVKFALEGRRFHRSIWRSIGHPLNPTDWKPQRILSVDSWVEDGLNHTRLAVRRSHNELDVPLHTTESQWLTDHFGVTYGQVYGPRYKLDQEGQ
jgi:hypothetical protein